MSLPKRVVEHKQPRVRRDLASALLSAAEKLPRPSNRSRRGDRDGDNSDADLGSWCCGSRCDDIPRTGSPIVKPRYGSPSAICGSSGDNQHIRRRSMPPRNSLAATFDRIVVLLSERGSIQSSGGDLRVTDDGRLLARIYSQSDLLVAECLRSGAWNGFAARRLAAVISAMVFEARGSDGPTPANVIAMPTAGVRRRWPTRRLGSPVCVPTRCGTGSNADAGNPTKGSFPAVHRWATTNNLAAALDASGRRRGSGTPLSAGTSSGWVPSGAGSARSGPGFGTR